MSQSVPRDSILILYLFHLLPNMQLSKNRVFLLGGPGHILLQFGLFDCVSLYRPFVFCSPMLWGRLGTVVTRLANGGPSWT